MTDLFGGNNVVGYDPDDEPGRFGISYNWLKVRVECTPEEGWAKWKIDRYCNNQILNTKAGNLLPFHTFIEGHNIRLSHIIWVFHTNGIWAEDELDHKDRNRSNNKISNLREATHSQNGMNKRILKNNTSGATGIWWDSKTDKWRAKIQINYRQICLGYFDNFDDAVEVRHKAEDEYFGEFAARHSRPPRLPMKDLFAA